MEDLYGSLELSIENDHNLLLSYFICVTFLAHKLREWNVVKHLLVIQFVRII